MSDKDGKPVGQGSGFLVSKNGLIVTNYHVISEGNSAVVKLPDGAFYVVDGVLAADKIRDIAVIKAHGQNFRTLTLGNSDRVLVGEEVVAIGNPLSLESTVSNGIVSAVREVKEEGGKFLQITAPISPGSSGGPLFNMAGEVIGITTMYLKGGENLNFAIPINDAKSLLLNHAARLQGLPNEQSDDSATTNERNGQQSELSDTLRWMQNTLATNGATFFNGLLISIRLVDFSGCQTHFSAITRGETVNSSQIETLYSTEIIFNLGDIDSDRISLARYKDPENDAYRVFDAHTRNDEKKVVYKEGPRAEFSFAVNAEYGVRFEKAFRYAVTLCGGKPSQF